MGMFPIGIRKALESVSIPASLGIAVALAAALAAVSCNLPPSFGPEYRDTGTNFIVDMPLAVPPLAGDLVPPVGSLALWDWAWRGETGNIYQYMQLSPAGFGPDGTEPAWSLETVNLTSNPTFGIDLAGWANSGGTFSLAAVPSDIIHSGTLFFDTSDTANYIHTDSSQFIDIEAGIPHSYRLSMNALQANNLQYIQTDSYDKNNLISTGWVAGMGPYVISFNSIDSTSTSVLAFANIHAFSFDDVLAVRSDVPLWKWSLVLRLGLDDTYPSLVPGYYEFSVWVEKPAGYLFSTEAGRGDDPDYASRFITLRMIQTDGTTRQTVAEQSFDLTALAAGWNKVALRMPSGSNFSFSEAAGGQVMELSISTLHTDQNKVEPGTVLVSRPSLNYYLDGY